MKKTLLLGMLMLAGLGASAQGLPANAEAPDFTATDLEGNVHHLQEYLDQGKTVVMYCSAVWCGPCWQFHNTHYLSDIHHAFGPEGSDEVVVLYIETDPRTPEGELYGTDMPNVSVPGWGAASPPIGDWTADTPYPVMNSDQVQSEYLVNSWPTIYRICPSGTVGEPGIANKITRDTPQNLTTQIANSCNPVEGLDHWARVTSADLRYCDADVPVVAYVEGFGHALTSVQAELKKNGEVVTTQTFENLDLAAFEVGTITFTDIAGENDADYEVTLLQVNGASALTTLPDNNKTDFNVFPSASVESSNNVNITIHTDEWPSEMKLYIIYYNEEGTAMIGFQTPTYTNTTANKEKTFNYTTTLQDNVCYGVVMQDSVGDGWDFNETGDDVPHGVTITSGNGTVLFSHNGTFGSQVWQDATFKTNGTLGNDKFDSSKFAIFPNPSTGVFNFTTEETVDVTVLDITGKTVHTAKGINNGDAINLSALQSGMYIAKINGASGERVEKLVIK